MKIASIELLSVLLTLSTCACVANHVERALGAEHATNEGGLGAGWEQNPRNDEWANNFNASDHSIVADQGRRAMKTAATEAAYHTCERFVTEYGFRPGRSWGRLSKELVKKANGMGCDNLLAKGPEGFDLSDPVAAGKERIVVVVWTDIQGRLPYQWPEFVRDARQKCSTECVWTQDQSAVSRGQADAVFFLASTHDKLDFPRSKRPGIKYISFNLEPSTWPQVAKLLHNKSYMNRFDYTMSYEKKATLQMSYTQGLPLQVDYYHDAGVTSFAAKTGYGTGALAVAFASNCKSVQASARASFLQEIMKHMPVHSYGKCFRNRNEPPIKSKDPNDRHANKIEVVGNYLFYFAFENTDQVDDYISEKVFHGFLSGAVPVYWGGKNAEEYLPEHSVIMKSDFKDAKALAEYLKFLATNEEEYNKYHAWRDKPPVAFDTLMKHSAYSYSAMCRVCDLVASAKREL